VQASAWHQKKKYAFGRTAQTMRTQTAEFLHHILQAGTSSDYQLQLPSVYITGTYQYNPEQLRVSLSSQL